jgi:hypothetical protein
MVAENYVGGNAITVRVTPARLVSAELENLSHKEGMKRDN